MASPNVLTPAVRPNRPFPVAAGALLAIAVALETGLSLIPGRPFWELALGLRGVAALCACGLGSWLEDRLYTFMHAAPAPPCG